MDVKNRFTVPSCCSMHELKSPMQEKKEERDLYVSPLKYAKIKFHFTNVHHLKLTKSVWINSQ